MLMPPPQLATLRRTIDPVAHWRPYLATHGPLSGICRDPLCPQLYSKLAPPTAQGRLAYVQASAVLTDRLDDQVHVRVLLISVQNHEVAMLEREFVACEVPAGGQEFCRRSTARHRQNDVVHQFRGLATGSTSVRGPQPHGQDVEFPVLHDTTPCVPAFDSYALVGLQLQLAMPVDVLQMC